MSELTEVALEKAQAILGSECSPIGLMASPEGYPHVWARDSVITALGALHSPGYENCLRVSLQTLAGQQSELGAIPNNVSVATGRLDHTNAGSVDSNLWFILGHLFQYRTDENLDFLRAQWPALEKALLWLRYQDFNGCGLLEVHEAADWADLLANRFNILYDNVLWYAALRAMAELARPLGLDNSRYDSMADDVRHKLRIVLWVGVENEAEWGPNCPGHTEWKHTLSQVIRCWSSGLSSCPMWPSVISGITAMCSAIYWRSCLASLTRRKKNVSWITCARWVSPIRIRCGCCIRSSIPATRTGASITATTT